MAGSAEILDLLNDAVLSRDLDGRVRSWNAACVVLYGFRTDDAIGRRAHDLLRTQHAEALAALDDRVFADGRWLGEIRRCSASGVELHLEARWSIERDRDGRPNGIVEVCRDLTALKAAEASLERSKHGLRQLLDAMPMAVWLLNTEGLAAMYADLRAAGVVDIRAHLDSHPDAVTAAMDLLHVEDANQHVVNLFGARDAHELRGPVSRFWRQSPGTFKRAMIARYEGCTVFEEETKLLTLDGRLIDVLFTTTRTSLDARSHRSLVGFVDLTARMRAQENLERIRTDFAHAARISMLGELTASIAHELNQPLAAILAQGAAGQRWLNRSVPEVEEARVALGRIRDDAERAAGIVASLREMAVRRPMQRTPVALNEIVQDTLAFLSHELQSASIRVASRLDGGLPIVQGDRTLLRQVVANLVLNAAQAMTTAGTERPTIEIRTERATAAAARVTITDSGPGLDASVLPRLFQSFFTTKPNGIGLGLPICRTIVEAHAGSIEAKNGEGGGARFTFTIPADETAR